MQQPTVLPVPPLPAIEPHESYPFPSVEYRVKRLTFNFLYIGSDKDVIHTLSRQFQSGCTADCFAEAKQYLLRSGSSNQLIPDVIFFDQSVVRSEILAFHQFLKDEQFLLNTLLIYHLQQLTKEDLEFLQHYQLIDDVVDLRSEEINYGKKIPFLKKVKRAEGRGIVEPPLPSKEKGTFGSVCKRTIDFSVAFVLIVLLLPIMGIIALLLKLESSAPVLYISKRAGKGFRIFNFYKFRSMVPGADSKVEDLLVQNQYSSKDGPLFFKVANDPRITRLGKFLRNTSLDELPQLFNVLKGDMSLVGNRPLPIYEAVTLTTNEFVERFVAPAGITGLWQIKKRGNAAMSAEERVNLDICYSRNHGFLDDLKIIVQTPLALFQKTTV